MGEVGEAAVVELLGDGDGGGGSAAVFGEDEVCFAGAG